MKPKRVAVIGGGLAGLAVSHRLTELSRENKVSVELHLFEQSPRLGGVFGSRREGSFLVEEGPDSFISEKPAALNLCGRLGLESEIISTRRENRRSFVVRNGSLRPLPAGFYMIAPARVKTFLQTPLFSIGGKIRMLLEPWIPPKKDGDETIGSFIRRRFGPEALERVGQAMLAGVYAGNPEELSLGATLPKFQKWEREYGSVLRGLRAERGQTAAHWGEASGPRYTLFLSFRNGMETLVRELENKIKGAHAHTGTRIHNLRLDSVREMWDLGGSAEKFEGFDAVCLAVPAARGALLLDPESEKAADRLRGIRSESIATVNLAYRREAVGHRLDGFGFVVPAAEKCSFIACSFSSQKFEGRAPERFVLLRLFVGGYFGRSHFERGDEDLVRDARRDLQRLLKIREAPLFSHLQRYFNSMVQYRLGHPALVNEIHAELKKKKGLFMTGSAVGGAGIPDGIAHAERTAEELFQTIVMSGKEPK